MSKLLQVICWCMCVAHTTNGTFINQELKELRENLRDIITPCVQESFKEMDDLSMAKEFARTYKSKVLDYLKWLTCSLEAYTENCHIKNSFFDVRETVPYPFVDGEPLAIAITSYSDVLYHLLSTFMSRSQTMIDDCQRYPFLDQAYTVLTLDGIVNHKLLSFSEIDEVLKCGNTAAQAAEQTQMNKYARKRAAKKEREEQEKQLKQKDEELMRKARIESWQAEGMKNCTLGMWCSKFAIQYKKGSTPVAGHNLLYQLLHTLLIHLVADIPNRQHHQEIHKYIQDFKDQNPCIESIQLQYEAEYSKLRDILTKRTYRAAKDQIEQAIKQYSMTHLRSALQSIKSCFWCRFGPIGVQFILQSSHIKPGRIYTFSIQFPVILESVHSYSIALAIQSKLPISKADIDVDEILDLIKLVYYKDPYRIFNSVKESIDQEEILLNEAGEIIMNEFIPRMIKDTTQIPLKLSDVQYCLSETSEKS